MRLAWSRTAADVAEIQGQIEKLTGREVYVEARSCMYFEMHIRGPAWVPDGVIFAVDDMLRDHPLVCDFHFIRPEGTLVLGMDPEWTETKPACMAPMPTELLECTVR